MLATLAVAPLLIAPTLLSVPPAPFGALPSPAQLAWHDLEFYGFVHFSINTFTDKEWGDGDESESLFAPTDLDCAQWAREARACGMQALILTCKHHDGFCLWPSQYTSHSVRSSQWRAGAGDVVGELAAACRAQGLRFGIYLSPWDRNHADYGKPEYVGYYRKQLEELVSRYGPVFEVWFDGANGGRGFYGGAREDRTIDRKTYYGWPTTNELVERISPGAIIFSDAGPGCRWVGNESGVSDQTSWQTLNLAGRYPGCDCAPILARGEEGGSHWVGVECDVSIRPGWFFHASENDKVKSGRELVGLYLKSVGRGANLLLNVPPDRRGLWHENDVRSLREMHSILDSAFRTDLARQANAAAPRSRAPDPDGHSYVAANINDGDARTYWAADDDATTGELVLEWSSAVELDTVRLREPIALGQRVRQFAISIWQDGNWQDWSAGATIGPRRILVGPKVRTDRLRIRIEDAAACPLLSEAAVFLTGLDPELSR